MISSLLSFNDIEEIASYIETKDEINLLKFISNKGDIIDFLHTIRNSIYYQKPTVSFKIKSENFSADMVFDKSQFLYNIPNKEFLSLNYNKLIFNFSYPTVHSINPLDNILTCIKSINNKQFNINQMQELKEIVGILPVKDYNYIIDYIKKNIISKLNTISIFDTKRDIKTKFTFNNEDVINILFFVCKYSLSYLQQLKVILMKESNFTYTDFDRITVEQSINYYKVLKEMTNDREQQ